MYTLLGEIVLRFLDDEWEVIDPLTYMIGHHVITVPRGFVTDGATIPFFAWSHIGHPLAPKFVKAAILHDYLYESKVVSRKEADRLFRMILKEEGVGMLKRWTMWSAVRLCGGDLRRILGRP